MTERKIPDSMERVEFKDVEDVLHRNLFPVFGERFTEYRKNYVDTLNSEHTGFVPPHPLTVTLELVNRCNLNCVMCYTVNHKGQKYTLDMDSLRKFFADCTRNGVPSLMLGDHSEALLYKEIREVILVAKAAGIMDIFLFTNGVLLTEELSAFLVQEQISRVFVSLDAATPETYIAIRGKDELARIERNLLKLLEIRRDRDSELPMVRVSFCVQQGNHQEQDAFHRKWEGVVDYIDYQAASDVSWVTELVETGTVKDAKLLEADTGHKLPFCNQPFGYLCVLSSGDITPCCNFYAHNLKIGHISRDTIQDVWNGEAMKTLRQELLTGNFNNTCRVCLSQRYNDFSPGVQQASVKDRD